MKHLGLFYLALYIADCGLSIIATFAQDLASLSNLLSSAVMLFSIVMLVVTLMNHLQPKWVYLLLSGSYLAISFVAGSVIGALLAAKGDVQALPENITPDFLAGQFDWYWPVHWAILIYLVIVVTVGLWAVATRSTRS